jgi:hypothetical protein
MQSITLNNPDGTTVTFYPQSYTDQAVAEAVANVTASITANQAAIDDGSMVAGQTINTVTT